jgi:hypothetical protein
MKIKDFKKINISINGDENNRSEIVYNNIISNLNLTSEEQVKYLKNKAALLELELKNRKLTTLLCIISIIGISFGIGLLAQDLYILGSLFIIITFIGVILRFSLMYKSMIENTKSKEFEKIESLKNILEEKLK